MKIKVLIVYPNIPLMLVTPLAVASFVWIIRNLGHDVDIFDTTKYFEENLDSAADRMRLLQARKTDIDEVKNNKADDSSKMLEDFKDKLDKFKPNLLLYSFTEDSLLRALSLLNISNKYNIPTIVGGIVATSAPDWLLNFDEINIIAYGEGERIVEESVKSIAEGKSLDNINGLWIKTVNGITKNPAPENIVLDDYLTDFSLFEDDRFVRPIGNKIVKAVPIETFRGCPNKCTYCNSPIHNVIARDAKETYLRRRSINGIKNQVEGLIKDYNINFFWVVDDDFLARPNSEIYEFIEMYKSIKVPFWMNTRVEHITEDILIKLEEVGMYRVSFGLESGSEEFRKQYLGRGASNEKLLKKFDEVSKSGIDFTVNVIIGLPYETRERIFETVDFCKQIKNFDSLTVSIFTPYHGTVLRDLAIKEGWLDENQLTKHTTSTSMLNMPQLTSEQIDGLMKTLPLYIMFDEDKWPEIKKIEDQEDGHEELLEYYSELYRKNQWQE